MNSESLVKRVAAWPVRLKDYFEELRTEMRRVTWPSYKQVRATTLVVIASVFAFAGFFFVVDLVISRSVGKVFETFTQ